jgi:hypothetical protein
MAGAVVEEVDVVDDLAFQKPVELFASIRAARAQSD